MWSCGVEVGQRQEVVIDGRFSLRLEIRLFAVDLIYLLVNDSLGRLIKLRVVLFVEELLPSQLVSRLGQHLLVILPGDRQHSLRLDAVVLGALAIEGVRPRAVVG